MVDITTDTTNARLMGYCPGCQDTIDYFVLHEDLTITYAYDYVGVTVVGECLHCDRSLDLMGFITVGYVDPVNTYHVPLIEKDGTRNYSIEFEPDCVVGRQ